jgi:predicted phage tail component-like protein
MNNKWSGSFLGFTINGIHSSQLGIVRTYDKEYELKQASFSDETQEREGRDGEDWYGTLLGSKEIPISFAYYGLTEYQLSQIKKLFNTKKPIPLILDEEPHKTWMVYSDSSATRSYIGFEMNGDRYYNGEGQVTFVSHSPYAKCELLCEEDYTEDRLLNKE